MLRKKDTESYLTNLIVDEDALRHDDGTSILTGRTNEGLEIDFVVKTKDLYSLAMIIVNKMEENEDNN